MPWSGGSFRCLLPSAEARSSLITTGLLLAYDDFESDDAAFVRVRIVNVEGVGLDQQFQLFRARTVVSEILAGDLLGLPAVVSGGSEHDSD